MVGQKDKRDLENNDNVDNEPQQFFKQQPGIEISIGQNKVQKRGYRIFLFLV